MNMDEILTRCVPFSNYFFYWRSQQFGLQPNSWFSFFQMDHVEDLDRFNCSPDKVVFSGVAPHHLEVKVDTATESIYCFSSFWVIKVFPFLHKNDVVLPI